MLDRRRSGWLQFGLMQVTLGPLAGAIIGYAGARLLDAAAERKWATTAFQGIGISIVPATAAPGWIGGPWTRIPVEGLSRRTVGIAHRRRGMLTMAAQVAERVIRQIIVAQAPEVPGLHLIKP